LEVKNKIKIKPERANLSWAFIKKSSTAHKIIIYFQIKFQL